MSSSDAQRLAYAHAVELKAQGVYQLQKEVALLAEPEQHLPHAKPAASLRVRLDGAPYWGDSPTAAHALKMTEVVSTRQLANDDEAAEAVASRRVTRAVRRREPLVTYAPQPASSLTPNKPNQQRCALLYYTAVVRPPRGVDRAWGVAN